MVESLLWGPSLVLWGLAWLKETAHMGAGIKGSLTEVAAADCTVSIRESAPGK